jgi:DNA-binding CsgD family transcriptional regulator
MRDKYITNSDNNQNFIHRLPAGMMMGDLSTELFSERTTKKVFAISNGKTVSFEDLNPKMRAQIFERLLDDDRAIEDLKHLTQKEAIEHYAFCVFGAADSAADFCADGHLQEADNFICSDNCLCLNWKSKKIKIDGEVLTPRQLEIVKLLATDLCDKQIADKLGICLSTLDTHKKTLFEKCNVSSKTGLVIKLIEQKIIQ